MSDCYFTRQKRHECQYFLLSYFFFQSLFDFCRSTKPMLLERLLSWHPSQSLLTTVLTILHDAAISLCSASNKTLLSVLSALFSVVLEYEINSLNELGQDAVAQCKEFYPAVPRLRVQLPPMPPPRCGTGKVACLCLTCLHDMFTKR